jgi:hypothetical protein
LTGYLGERRNAVDGLSPRERDVLDLLAKGLHYQAIADRPHPRSETCWMRGAQENEIVVATLTGDSGRNVIERDQLEVSLCGTTELRPVKDQVDTSEQRRNVG